MPLLSSSGIRDALQDCTAQEQWHTVSATRPASALATVPGTERALVGRLDTTRRDSLSCTWARERGRVGAVQTRRCPMLDPLTTVNVKLPRRGSSLGVAGCILGTLALPISLVPLIGLIGVPLSALGLLLGVAGLLVAVFRKGSGIGFAIAGSAISALALFVGIASTVATSMAVEAGSTAVSDAAKEAEKTNQ